VITRLLVGSYTVSRPGVTARGRGIVSVPIAGGTFGDPVLVAETPNPVWLCRGRPGEILAVSETAQGAVVVFDDAFREGQSQALPTRGDLPTHIAVSPDAQHALIANYGDGSVSLLDHDGVKWNFADRLARPPGSHPHQIVHNAPKDEWLVPDLGLDCIHRFCVDDGTLRPCGRFSLPDHTGPRHLVIDAERQRAVVAGELDGTLTVIDLQAETNAIIARRPIRPVDTRPPGAASAIRWIEYGRSVVVAVRGDDVVRTLGVDESGLHDIDLAPTGGRSPRDVIVEDGVLVIACQDDDRLVSMRIGTNSSLKGVIDSIDVPSPACVLAAR